jgi:hypothetical protein
MNLTKFFRPKNFCINDDGTFCVLLSHLNCIDIFVGNIENAKYISLSEIGINEIDAIALSKTPSHIYILSNALRSLFYFNFHAEKIVTKKITLFNATAKIKAYKNKTLLQDKFSGAIHDIEEDSLYIDPFKLPSNISHLSFLSFDVAKNGNVVSIEKNSEGYFLMHYLFESGAVNISKLIPHERSGAFLSLRNPTDIIFVGTGFLICDTDNYELKFLDFNFELIYSLGGKSSDLNYFDMAANASLLDNNIYISDSNNDRILKINLTSKYTQAFISRTFKPDVLARPTSIIEAYGDFFIADRDNGSIQILDKNLNFIGHIKNPNFFLRPCALSINFPHSFVYILDRYGYKNSRISLLSLKKPYALTSFSLDSKINLNDPQDIACLPNGNLLIADTLNRKILRICEQGKLLYELDLMSLDGNESFLIKNINVTEEGKIIFTDFEKLIIYELNDNFILHNKYDLSMYRDKIKYLRGALKVGSSSFILLDRSGEINLFDSATYNLTSISPQAKDSRYNNPAKIIFRNNNLYIADKENDRICKIDLNP